MKRLIAMLMLVAGLASAELTVEAELDRPSMSTDDAAVMTVTVKGGQRVAIELPVVEGVSYREMGRSQNMQIINGAVSVSLTQQILVQVAEAGSYEIPAVRVAGGGEEAFSQAAMRLEVVKGSGKRRGAGAAAAPNMGGKPAAGGGVAAEDVGELAFLTAKPRRTELVVGELVPVEVKAYFRSGERVSLRSLPAVGGGAFTLKNQEGKPRQEEVTVDGVAYTALTFYAGMAAVKPGEFPVEVELDATVVVREKGSGKARSGLQGMRQRMQSLFNDPFFGDPFGDDFFGRLVEKEVKLKSDVVAVTVREVPVGGRPQGYAGAVGNFSLTASAAVERVAVGEPVTVKLTVTGEGNFDRVGVPQLAEPEGWKTYPATSESVAGDAIGYSGTKVFERVIVPERGGTESVEFELPFYNVEEERFEVARSGLVALAVSGEAVAAEVVAEPEVEAGGEMAVVESVEEAASGVVAVRPLYGRWWFASVCGVALVVVVSCGVRALVGGRRNDPGLEMKRATEREIEASVAGMERAMAETDAVAFFESMRRAVQVYAGRLSGVAPEAVTAADVGDVELKEMLVAADAVVFSGMPVEVGEMAGWLGRTERLRG
ncbi:MAG: BatD family protein [Verrucomicrobiales bacterium]|nr:BatD family protein [Verrucomicrobiales bacterium]